MNSKGKILVTGGTGYIGSHTVVELLNENYEVAIVDNLSNSDEGVLDKIREITGVKPEFCQLDLCDKDDLQEFFAKNRDIDSVIHFAAYKAVGESTKKPLKYYRNNLVSTINLLECMIDHKVTNIVFSSSCTVYGQPDQLPVDETAPVKEPLSPYGNTKQTNERVIQYTIEAGNPIKGISLRYFNPIGAHPSAKIGEIPRGVPNNLVPYITQTAIGIRDELKVFGNDYNTPDGTPIRDYINVVDLAKAHVAAIARLIDNKNKTAYEYFNLGTGRGNTVLEVIHAFERATGKKLNYKIVGRRPGDVEQVYADTSYANKELGWKAEKTLEETLRSAWEFEKAYRDKN
ncbi:MAG: UDP-glucose 4-epimerase GalE [Bacteroidales bacterium]|nr:UDP-glucose 4-epimerase GalE [Bacteroidales bacterium]